MFFSTVPFDSLNINRIVVSTTSTTQYASPYSTSTFFQPTPSPTTSQAVSTSLSSQLQRLAASASASNVSNPSNASNPSSPTSSQTQAAGNHSPVEKTLGFIIGMAVGLPGFGVLLFAAIFYKCRKMRRGQSSTPSDREQEGFTAPSHRNRRHNFLQIQDLQQAEGMSDWERLRSSASHTMRSNGIEVTIILI